MLRKVAYFIFFIYSVSIYANYIEDDETENVSLERLNNVSLDIAGCLIGTYTLRYERQLADFFSLTVPLEIHSWALAPWPDYQRAWINRNLFGYTLPDLLFTTGMGANFKFVGMYLEPFFKLGLAQINYEGQIGTKYAAAFEPGIRAGKKWILDFGLSFDIGGGLSFRFHAPKYLDDILPRFEITLALGYAW